jgi:uncharacterized protein (UPF0303 family)
MSAENISRIAAQEQRLVFQSFDESAAFSLGSAIRATAEAGGLSIVVDVRLWDRPLFYAAMAGTTADNVEWVRRKIGMTRRFHKASYRLALEYRIAGKVLSRDIGLDPIDYCLAGGCVPIRVAGIGVVGAATVSGVPEWIDHALVVEAMAAQIGVDIGERVLPPN